MTEEVVAECLLGCLQCLHFKSLATIHDDNSYRVLCCLFFATFLSLISVADPLLQGVTDVCTNLAALLSPIHH